uniref:TRAF family member associated NFKB activator n=1 Tax=Catharus ustulatus TaxID=91951 RepID=A0A8C3VKM0_CATUS
MDKNIGEQLNKAYEAYRQACMDRDHAVKELQQKTENYMQQIREQQEKIELQNSIIAKLKSQLAALNANRGMYSSLVLHWDGRWSLEQALQGSCHGTEPLRIQRMSGQRSQFCGSGLGSPARSKNLETIFQDMKEECHRICMLAREQTDQLSIFKIKPEPETEIQFSMPIQCTDKTDEQAEELFKPRVIKDINRGASCITSITPRGVGQDEDNNSVESLSKFNVKFPPTDNDSAFLQSTQEKPTVPCTGISENILQDHHFNLEHRDRAVNLSKLEPNSFEAHGIDLMTSALQSLTTVDKTNPSDHAKMPIENICDRSCLKTTDSGFTFVPKHTNQGVPEAIFSLEAAGTTVRGPHQPIWQPQDNDLLAQAYADSELNQCGICEFCREVFPPSLTSKEDFLRHLNSHFKVQS